MIADRVLGNLRDLPEEELRGLHVEQVMLSGDDLVKRIQRLTTDHGREIGLRLTAPAGPVGDLHDGDILARQGDNLVVVRALPTDVLVIAADSIHQMGVVAHNLGNRHLPAQFFHADSGYGAEVMVVPYDHTVEDLLTHLNVPHSRQSRVLQEPFRHTEHTH